MKKELFVVLILIFSFLFLSGCLDPPENDVGEEFVFLDLDGSEIRLSSYRGKVVILDMWATWCNPRVLA